MNRSHENLPKFNGKFDPDYLILRPYLQKIWTDAPADIQLRFQTGSQPEESSEEPRGLVQLWPSEDTEAATGKQRTEFEYGELMLDEDPELTSFCAASLASTALAVMRWRRGKLARRSGFGICCHGA